MRNLLKLTDLTKDEIIEIFKIAAEIENGKYRDYLKGKSAVTFFPSSSIRTRATFEKGVYLLGGQTVLFPSEALDKKEELRDVCGYLANWADLIIARHKDIDKLKALAEFSSVPVISAMSDENHPCEILSDLYALSKLRRNFTKDNYLFCGVKGNIGLTWRDASELLGFSLSQCCPKGGEMDGVPSGNDIDVMIAGKDIVCTDSLPSAFLSQSESVRVTKAAMDKANDGALLNPCPPFYRGEEVSADAIESDYFVGYGFKKSLLTVQQAVMIFCLEK